MMHRLARNSIQELKSLFNLSFLGEGVLFFSSEAPGLIFSATYLRGIFAPSALSQHIGACGFPR